LTQQRRYVLAALLIAAALVGGLVVVARGQSVDERGAPPPVSVPPTRTPTPPPMPPSPRPTPTPTTAGPPASTAHVHDRHRARYDGVYAGWDDLLDDGRKLPEITDGCRSAWQRATRDDALDWDKAGYLCLDRVLGRGFKPQGIGGSGTTEDYLIGGRSARTRNILLISSYSAAEQPALVFPNEPGRTDATRLTVIDVDRRRYNTVELVRPVGPDSFTALDSHGSGFAWVGQYMYSSSRGSLWMYNADDLMRIDGRYVLPAVARWSVSGQGGLSSLGIDRTKRSTRLIGINYSETGTAWSHGFQLDATGRLKNGSKRARHKLELTGDFGPGPASVRSSSSSVVPGTNFQGIGTSGRYRFVNSSSLMLDGKRHGDHLVILKRSTMIARFSMPSENVESLYVDHRRGRYVTITEHGRQFLFWLPVAHLIDRAER
jgi:hypothetical protein